ncbi:hypothetical protein ACI7RC_10715 [Brevibacillus sp. B_LB10_24]|uniref:hypothetical protein n=1 Tax=Brevibacillus sp. B_LB10_24 TaxID=3380645 RepID=UPI0038BD6FAD
MNWHGKNSGQIYRFNSVREYPRQAFNARLGFFANVSNYENCTKGDLRYDANGLRATKQENNLTTHCVYLNGKVIEELDDKGNVTAQNIWGNQLLFRKDAASNESGYYLYNSHGVVVAITDVRGETLNRYEYDSWGNIVSQQEAMSNPFKYTGEMYDSESKLYYLRAGPVL